MNEPVCMTEFAVYAFALAPNNAPTVSHCLGVAAADKGVSIGLDIFGAIPAVGNAVSAGAGIVRAGIAVNHVITAPAFAVGSGVYGAYCVPSWNQGDSYRRQFVSVATLGFDGYQAYNKYQSCLAGH